MINVPKRKVLCFLLFLAAAVSAVAQPAWSKGGQILTASHEEGMKRARRSLEAEGYAITNTGSDFTGGAKGIHSAVITCVATTEGQLHVIIFVASAAVDGGVPGAERERLQAQMFKSSTSASNAAPPGTWDVQANGLHGKVGDRFTLSFPPGGVLSGRLWGTDVYTDDSSIATAAVHAGLISVQSGGTVTIEIRPGQSAYQGSVRNGVTSSSYGSWGASFVFVR